MGGGVTPTAYYLARSGPLDGLSWHKNLSVSSIAETVVASPIPSSTSESFVSVEVGNTKKKRVAEVEDKCHARGRSHHEKIERGHSQHTNHERDQDQHERGERKGSFGDPVKIARYFPELTLPA